MKKNILITGANGMLAKALARKLNPDYSVKFLTRNPIRKNEYKWDLEQRYIDKKAFDNINYIVHLAGSSIAEKRWSNKRKKNIISSRIDSAQLIRNEIQKNNIVLDGFISASAIGYYGTETSSAIFTEDSPLGNDFLSSVCKEWEDQTRLFQKGNFAKRTAIVRIGIIFSENGGAFQKIVNPIKYGIGAAIGKGNQYMPWIHIDDLCGVFKLLLDNENMNGTYNAVAPEHITNKELTQMIGSVLKKKIFLPNIPSFVFKLIFGEMSIIILKGSRVSSEKITSFGYQFQYPTIKKALQNLLN